MRRNNEQCGKAQPYFRPFQQVYVFPPWHKHAQALSPKQIGLDSLASKPESIGAQQEVKRSKNCRRLQHTDSSGAKNWTAKCQGSPTLEFEFKQLGTPRNYKREQHTERHVHQYLDPVDPLASSGVLERPRSYKASQHGIYLTADCCCIYCASMLQIMHNKAGTATCGNKHEPGYNWRKLSLWTSTMKQQKNDQFHERLRGYIITTQDCLSQDLLYY